MGTGRPPDLLYDLGVHLITHLHLVPPVITIADILPMSHINNWLTAKVVVTSASLDKNCLYRTLLSSCSHTTVTAVGLNF